MSVQADLGGPRRSTWLRSTGAVLAGLVTIIGLSLGADVALHAVGIYPPWGEPMREAGDNALALAYRTAFVVAGAYLTARLAPAAPMRHALYLGGINFGLSVLGAVVTVVMMDLGADWYPLGLVLVSFPAAWFGGHLFQLQQN
jgi:hypothetical protein